MIITIGREYGSGGHFIAQKLAEKLGIPCYDKEIIEGVVKKGDFAETYIETNEEKAIPTFLSFDYDGISNPERLFLEEYAVIKQLAKNGDCIIVGRCADYVLQDRKDLVKVFIEAPLEDKIERSIKYYGIEPSKAKDIIIKANKKRAKYYNYFTDRKWGRSDCYDLVINSSCGVDEATEIIALYAKAKTKNIK